MLKWLKRVVLAAVGVALLALIAVIAVQDATPFSARALEQRAKALFAYGSVEVPHELAGAEHAELALFNKVADGQGLTKDESKAYRRAFQGVLADNQRLFRALDNNLVFATDYAMDVPNSICGQGIAGRHDLHAASARSNFVELAGNLEALSNSGALTRVWNANEAYKNLTDLMVHLAPAVHSVVVDVPEVLPAFDSSLSVPFETFRDAFQQAGFAPVNSREYHAAIAEGVAAYARLAEVVQTQITSELSPFEHKLAGRWLALHSVSPQLSLP